MQDDNLKPEIFALPPGPNGLPDILMISKSYVHEHAVVRAFVVPSERTSTGFWCERFNADGPDALKWAMLMARERVQEHYYERRAAIAPTHDQPFELKPFEDWMRSRYVAKSGFIPLSA